jgi:hypothetical protein
VVAFLMGLDRTTFWSDAVSEPLTGEHFGQLTIPNGSTITANSVGSISATMCLMMTQTLSRKVGRIRMPNTGFVNHAGLSSPL